MYTKRRAIVKIREKTFQRSVRFVSIASLILLLTLALTACSSSAAPDEDRAADVTEEQTHDEEAHSHEEEADSHEEEVQTHDEEAHSHEEEDHGHQGVEAHGIPEDAAAVPNPIAASAESVEIGAEVFATNCVVCHGETGRGDGPSAVGLDPRPADLSEGHVQDLSDGALLYVIHNGVAETAMPAWKDVLGEEDIWHVVNFLRTFRRD